MGVWCWLCGDDVIRWLSSTLSVTPDKGTTLYSLVGHKARAAVVLAVDVSCLLESSLHQDGGRVPTDSWSLTAVLTLALQCAGVSWIPPEHAGEAAAPTVPDAVALLSALAIPRLLSLVRRTRTFVGQHPLQVVLVAGGGSQVPAGTGILPHSLQAALVCMRKGQYRAAMGRLLSLIQGHLLVASFFDQVQQAVQTDFGFNVQFTTVTSADVSRSFYDITMQWLEQHHGVDLVNTVVFASPSPRALFHSGVLELATKTEVVRGRLARCVFLSVKLCIVSKSHGILLRRPDCAPPPSPPHTGSCGCIPSGGVAARQRAPGSY